MRPLKLYETRSLLLRMRSELKMERSLSELCHGYKPRLTLKEKPF
tara:strand:- start:48791 stop:48925 length:135 start_codon:yes stop_codon:yes gene_type:complete